jgi:hypothetical protein
MALPTIDLHKTRFPVSVQKPKADGGKPDIADVVYAIHRCAHGHGEALPAGFELLPDAAGPPERTTLLCSKGRVHLSDRVIFGLLAVAIFNPANIGQQAGDGYHLTMGREYRFVINEWWGRLVEFEEIVASQNLIKVVMDFGDWMEDR